MIEERMARCPGLMKRGAVQRGPRQSRQATFAVEVSFQTARGSEGFRVTPVSEIRGTKDSATPSVTTMIFLSRKPARLVGITSESREELHVAMEIVNRKMVRVAGVEPAW